MWNATLDWKGLINQLSCVQTIRILLLDFVSKAPFYFLGSFVEAIFIKDVDLDDFACVFISYRSLRLKAYFVGNKAKGRISKRVFQENKARQIFRKNEHF